MAVLGWIGLWLVTAVLVSGLRRGEGGRGVFAVRFATGMVGAVVGGFVAVVAGVGPMADFFHTGTWLIALGGAVLALFVYELAKNTRDSREIRGPQSGRWAGGRAGGESERLDRNW